MSMTRKEATHILQNGSWWDCLPDDMSDADMNPLQDALDVALSALRPITREQVEKLRGEWKHYLPPLGAGDVQCRCTRCGRTPDVETPFCAWCGAPVTDEAVDMVMERLEELHDTSN